MVASSTLSPLDVGTVAPDFTLASTPGTPFSLSAHRGQSAVLLAFFPLAFTGVCTTELCAFSEDFDQFTGRGVTIVPISVDAVPSLAEFKRKFSMKTDLCSDMKREVSRAYGVLLEEAYISTRAYFLIDRDGVIRWRHVEASPGDRRENAELLDAIASLNA
jgi:peroxiredoxin